MREFFKHHPDNDPLYLKRYVKEHPDNKMAWYLLGREYAAQGKQGKALYCFTKAGEVYEAFEEQAAPVIEEESKDDPLQQKQMRRKGFLPWTRRIIFVMLAALLLFYIPSPAYEREGESMPASIPPAEVQQTKVYYIAKEKTKENVGAALQEIIVKEKLTNYSILVQGQPSPDNKWIWWLKKPQVLLSVEGKADSAQLQIEYHDAASCDCQPTEPVKPLAIFAPWAAQQEQELILRSALAAFYRINGRLPADLPELSRPYPDNLLPGVTPYMEEKYRKEKDLLGSEAVKLATAPAADSAAVPKTQQTFAKPLTEPLQIVIDKTAHRLALVSGSIILRSYPVGLGGAKTPEAEFVISEKVRNPNGKSNGEFGSRGMTLGDTLYAIHGTNKPASIGKDESHGCIRMLQQDVEELFDMVPLGTKVTIGKGLLPPDIERSGTPFQMPLFSEETNPGKVYKWLD
nr:L,D-transpeptidase [Paenibacillus hamazuiensis]